MKKTIRKYCHQLFGEGHPLCWGAFKARNIGEVVPCDKGVYFYPDKSEGEVLIPWRKAVKYFGKDWVVILSHPLRGTITEEGQFLVS